MTGFEVSVWPGRKYRVVRFSTLKASPRGLQECRGTLHFYSQPRTLPGELASALVCSWELSVLFMCPVSQMGGIATLYLLFCNTMNWTPLASTDFSTQANHTPGGSGQWFSTCRLQPRLGGGVGGWRTLSPGLHIRYPHYDS